MKITILVVFLLLFQIGYSQGQKIDSIQNLLEGNINDSLKAHYLNELSYYHITSDAKQGLITANKALRFAQKTKYPGLTATAYKRIGQNLSVLGRNKEALNRYGKAIEIFKKNGDSAKLASLYYSQGLIYFAESNYELSTRKHQAAFNIFKRLKDTVLMAKMLNSISINLMYKSDYPTALANYLKAARLYEDAKADKSLEYAQVINNLGLLYARLEDYAKSIDYHERALSTFRSLGNKQLEADALSNLANTNDYMGNEKMALDLYEQSHTLQKEIGNKLGTANALTNIGITIISLGQNNEAIGYLEKAATVYEELSNTANLAITHENIGKAYFNLYQENNFNNRFLHNAKISYERALTHAQEANTLNTEQRAWQGLAKAHALQNNYKAAYTAKIQSEKLKESINSEATRSKIARLEAQYAYDKKEAVLTAKNEKREAIAFAEIKRQKYIKNTVILGGSALLTVGFLSLFLIKRKRDAVAKQERAEFEAKVSDTELKALRAQMNPHFIFNALNSINHFIENHERQQAGDYLAKFAALMRKTLVNSEKKEVLLAEDLDFLKLYLEIEAKRLNHKFSWKIEVNPQVDTQITLVPPGILQPFVENSIWHGITSLKDTGHIKIEIKQKDGMLIYAVEDNGVGRNGDPKKLKKNGDPQGITITENRVDILNQMKNSKGEVRFIDKKKGLRVEVKLPLEKEF